MFHLHSANVVIHLINICCALHTLSFFVFMSEIYFCCCCLGRQSIHFNLPSLQMVPPFFQPPQCGQTFRFGAINLDIITKVAPGKSKSYFLSFPLWNLPCLSMCHLQVCRAGTWPQTASPLSPARIQPWPSVYCLMLCAATIRRIRVTRINIHSPASLDISESTFTSALKQHCLQKITEPCVSALVGVQASKIYETSSINTVFRCWYLKVKSSLSHATNAIIKWLLAPVWIRFGSIAKCLCVQIKCHWNTL